MKHLAIDVETLSLQENAHILSIGAVFFCPETKKLGDTFYVGVNINEEQKGAHISSATVGWWLDQISNNPQSKIEGRASLEGALLELTTWIKGRIGFEMPLIYQQGSKDSDWLHSAAERHGIKLPWCYQNVYCARSLWRHAQICPDHKDYEGIAHNALDDAKFVAYRMLELPVLSQNGTPFTK